MKYIFSITIFIFLIGIYTLNSKASGPIYEGQAIPLPGLPTGMRIYKFIDHQMGIVCYARSSIGESISCLKY